MSCSCTFRSLSILHVSSKCKSTSDSCGFSRHVNVRQETEVALEFGSGGLSFSEVVHLTHFCNMLQKYCKCPIASNVLYPGYRRSLPGQFLVRHDRESSSIHLLCSLSNQTLGLTKDQTSEPFLHMPFGEAKLAGLLRV